MPYIQKFSMKKLFFLLIILISISTFSQQVYYLDLEKSIEIAKGQSLRMLILNQNLERAGHELDAATKRFKTHIDLNLKTPNYTETIREFEDTTGISFYPVKQLNYTAGLTINQPLPTDGNLFVSSNVSSTDDFYDDNKLVRTNTSINLEQPIESFYAYNSIKAGYEQARLNYELTQKNLKRSELDLFYNVSRSFYNLLKADKRKEIANQTLKRQEEAYEIAQNKYKAGLIREVEALQMEVDLGQAQNDYDIAVVEYNSQNNIFKQSLGIPLSDTVKLENELVYKIILVDLDKAISLGLEHRMELKEKEIAIKLTELELKRQKSQGMINGDIKAYYDFIGVNKLDLPTSFSTGLNNSFDNMMDRPGNFGVGLNLSIPLIDWGENKSKVKAIEASIQRSKYELEDETINVEREIIATVDELMSSMKRLQLLEKNVQVAEKSFDISRYRFTNGDIDSQALALDRIRLNNAHISYLDAYISYKLLIADLMRKTFYDFENDVSVLSQ